MRGLILLVKWFCDDELNGIFLAYIKRSDDIKKSMVDRYSKMTTLMILVKLAAMKQDYCWGCDFYNGDIGSCKYLFEEIEYVYVSNETKDLYGGKNLTQDICC